MKLNSSHPTDKASSFFGTCKEKFKYLVSDYGFSIIFTQKDGNLWTIIFQNKTTAVIVNWEHNENWIYIELYRLVNGKLLRDPTIISKQTKLNGYYLDDLLSLRYPKFSSTAHLRDRNFIEILENYSELLSQFASDVLKGDFAIFEELRKVVNDRISSMKDNLG